MTRFARQLLLTEIVRKNSIVSHGAVRYLILIYPVDQLNMMEELEQITKFSNMHYKLTK